MNFKNRPPHFFNPSEIYFITAKTREHKNFFDNDFKKNILKKYIFEFAKNYNCPIYAWAILNNHHHLLLKNGGNLKKCISAIVGKTAIELNKLDNISGRKIWYNYWDHQIRDQKDFFKHFNYIHQNPIKHNLVKNLEELKSYKFCSYKYWVDKKGEDWLMDCFERYPIINFITPE